MGHSWPYRWGIAYCADEYAAVLAAQDASLDASEKATALGAEQVQPRLVPGIEEPTVPVRTPDGSYAWQWGGVVAAVQTLIGVLEHARVRAQILGPSGPTLAAEGLHPWVWHAAVALWDGGHYKQAVTTAAAAVEKQTQMKLGREDISGTKLYTEAFALDARTGHRRLRFGQLPETTDDGNRTEAWKSAHEGAMNFGKGCAQGIRNMPAGPLNSTSSPCVII